MKLRLCGCSQLVFSFPALGNTQALAQNAHITNQGSGNVSVIDTATNKMTATIAVSGAPLGVAVSLDGGTVFVANIDSDNVSVIDTATNAVIGGIPSPAIRD